MLSCNAKKQATQIEENIKAFDGNDTSYYYERLHLEDLRFSRDSSSIRFWLTYTSLVDSGKIVNLKYRQGAWQAEFITYRFKLMSIKDTCPALLTRTYVLGSPVSGWESLLSQFKKIGLYSINDNDRKENYGLCSDDNILKVEILNNMNYSEYIYPCWESIKNQEHVSKVIESLKLIEAQFGFKIQPFLPGPRSL